MADHSACGWFVFCRRPGAKFPTRAIEEELKVSSVWYSLGLTQGVPAGFIKMEKSKPLLPLGDDATTVELSKLYVLSRFRSDSREFPLRHPAPREEAPRDARRE